MSNEEKYPGQTFMLPNLLKLNNFILYSFSLQYFYICTLEKHYYVLLYQV